MRTKLLFITLAVFGVVTVDAFSAPSNFILRPFTKVVKNYKDGWVDVYYTARCLNSEWGSVVSAFDDSGDQASVIGVAVPMDSNSCKPSVGDQEFSVRVTSGEQAYEVLKGDIVPMSVQ